MPAAGLPVASTMISTAGCAQASMPEATNAVLFGRCAAMLRKGVAQPFAGLVHRLPSLVNDADPEREPVVDAVIARYCNRDAGGPQPFGIEFTLVAQRVVFGGDDESRRQFRQYRGAQRRRVRMRALRRVVQIVVPEPFHGLAGQAVPLGILVIGRG